MTREVNVARRSMPGRSITPQACEVNVVKDNVVAPYEDVIFPNRINIFILMQ